MTDRQTQAQGRVFSEAQGRRGGGTCSALSGLPGRRSQGPQATRLRATAASPLTVLASRRPKSRHQQGRAPSATRRAASSFLASSRGPAGQWSLVVLAYAGDTAVSASVVTWPPACAGLRLCLRAGLSPLRRTQVLSDEGSALPQDDLPFMSVITSAVTLVLNQASRTDPGGWSFTISFWETRFKL